MLRRILGGPNAARNALVALLPLVIGVGLFLVAGDRPSTRSSLLETTQADVSPSVRDALETTSAADAPATPAGQVATENTTAGLLTPGPDAARTPGAGAASSPSPNAPSDPGTTTATGVGRSTRVTDGVSGGAGPEEADEPAAPAGERAPSTVPTGESTSTPTTRAPEATTTTTTAPAPARTGPVRDAAAAAEVVPLTNADRSVQGLGTLTRSACLDSIASGYAEQMARSGVLAHNPGAGAAALGCQPGGTWGDNVGTAVPCDTALLEAEWMASPTHRRNILTGAFRQIGVGAWTDPQGRCWVQVLFSS